MVRNLVSSGSFSVCNQDSLRYTKTGILTCVVLYIVVLSFVQSWYSLHYNYWEHSAVMVRFALKSDVTVHVKQPSSVKSSSGWRVW